MRHDLTAWLCVQGFSKLPHAGSLKFPSQPYNYVERVSLCLPGLATLCLSNRLQCTSDHALTYIPALTFIANYFCCRLSAWVFEESF